MIVTLLVLCLFLAFYLSGLESALMMVNRVHVRYAAEEGDVRAEKLYALLAQRNDLFHAATCLCHVFSLASFGLAALTLDHMIGHWGWAIAILLALPIFLLGLELIPKLLFKRHAFSILRRSLTLLNVLRALSRPLLGFAHRIWPSILRMPIEKSSDLGVEPLVDMINDQKLLKRSTSQLLVNFAQVQPKRATDLMIPLNRINALPIDLSLTNALVMTQQEDHQWRVILDAEGELVGWLDVLDIPPTPPANSTARHYMKGFSFCRAEDSVLQTLQLLRLKAEPVAAVKSLEGQIVGVICIDTLYRALFKLSK